MSTSVSLVRAEIRVDVTPDLAGYREAQERLRSVLGEPIVLLQAATRSYDPGVALDPETGEPYDPLIEPQESAQASAQVQGRIAFRGVPGSPDAASMDSALGWMEDTDVAVITGSAAASAASGAVSMVIRDERYEIRTARFDGIVGTDRYLIFGEKENTDA